MLKGTTWIWYCVASMGKFHSKVVPMLVSAVPEGGFIGTGVLLAGNGVGVIVTEGVPEGVTVADTVGDTVALAETVGLTDAVGDAVGPTEGVALGVALGVGVWVGMGSTAAALKAASAFTIPEPAQFGPASGLSAGSSGRGTAVRFKTSLTCWAVIPG